MAYGPDTIDMAGRELTDFRITGDIGPYRALLEDAVARRVPMLCANPDQRTIDVDGVTPLYMPGTMADAYRAMGGEVVLYGKPGVRTSAAALRAAGVDDAGRALMVGDSRATTSSAPPPRGWTRSSSSRPASMQDLAEVSEAGVARASPPPRAPRCRRLRAQVSMVVSHRYRAGLPALKNRARGAHADSHALGPKGQPRHGSVDTCSTNK